MTPPPEKQRILVVDDAVDTLEVLERNLASKGYQVHTAQDVPGALRLLADTVVDLVITDLKMPGASGMDLVRYVKENLADTEVMMITGYASVEGAVQAVKLGAEEYLSKPFTDEELFLAVRKVLDKLRTRRAVQSKSDDVSSPHGIIGSSRVMQEVFKAIDKAASTPATVLITGESGTGKELVARAIHYSGPRASSPFIPVNCGGIPQELLESELFGYVKGAFTGAATTRAGFFQTADGGTIFLDEISETSPAMQVKLLRVLQDKEVFMVGSRKPEKVDVRIVAASNKDLQSLIRKQGFREDLYYRLNVITIDLPPLRDRNDDILMLISHFACKYAEELDKQCPVFSDEALSVLKGYHWPGNVRELENVVQRLVVMVERDTVEVKDLPSLMRFQPPKGEGLDRTLAQVEAEYITNVLASVDGNKTRTARILGIDRKTLREKLKRLEESGTSQ
ncbi:response regulator [candidate division WOR-3 bacterium]|uniref:Response regulator n=1 Tax=candidate division WOR-3 bacterium TaxID=2052148 RepID=A0A9D5QCF7_UNCW3|nr:response regulator [candidate division WOR-3 bacterium]MBD3364633.1 response regulator [candidate division WOR-3 bacterium]